MWDLVGGAWKKELGLGSMLATDSILHGEGCWQRGRHQERLASGRSTKMEQKGPRCASGETPMRALMSAVASLGTG